MENPLVSVIIPSHNRFEGLLLALESISKQSLTDYEIIIINDGSDDERYLNYNFDKDIKVVHLNKNSVDEKGYFSDSIRNYGIEKAKGKYIAFLDDDDYWFSNKLEVQINKLESSNYKMTCSDAIADFGEYSAKNINYPYNQKILFNEISQIYKQSRIKNSFQKKRIYKFDFPEIWDFNFLKVHNCIITSSIVVERSLLNKIGNFRDIQNNKLYSDYDCWLGLLTHTELYYFKEPLLYYDLNSGMNIKTL